MTGIELIAAERQRQIAKGYTAEYDLKNNWVGTLTRTAIFYVTMHEKYFPVTSFELDLDRVLSLSKKQRLIRAGALIAAELDRMQKEEESKE